MNKFVKIKIKHVEDGTTDVTARGLIRDGLFKGEYTYKKMTYGVTFPIDKNHSIKPG